MLACFPVDEPMTHMQEKTTAVWMPVLPADIKAFTRHQFSIQPLLVALNQLVTSWTIYHLVP